MFTPFPISLFYQAFFGFVNEDYLKIELGKSDQKIS